MSLSVACSEVPMPFSKSHVRRVALALGLLSNAALAAPGWNGAADLPVARASHSVSVLASGKAIVVGGIDASGQATSATALYDMSLDQWHAAAPLAVARADHTATVIESGRLLVAGGTHAGAVTDAVEIYDPASDAWSNAASLSHPRAHATATTGRRIGPS